MTDDRFKSKWSITNGGFQSIRKITTDKMDLDSLKGTAKLKYMEDIAKIEMDIFEKVPIQAARGFDLATKFVDVGDELETPEVRRRKHRSSNRSSGMIRISAATIFLGMWPADSGALSKDLSCAVSPGVVIKEGFIEKRGGGTKSSGYKTRFFQLLSHHPKLELPCLAYGNPKLARTGEFIGMIPLVKDSCSVRADKEDSLCFAISVPGRLFELRTRSERDRDQWVVALSDILKQKIECETNSDAKQVAESLRLSISDSKPTGGVSMVMEGFLDKKKSTAFRFRSRFFRLYVDNGVKPMGSMTYASDERSWEVLGSIDIVPGTTTVSIVKSDKQKRTFMIKNPEVTQTLRSVGETDRNAWLRVINDTLSMSRSGITRLQGGSTTRFGSTSSFSSQTPFSPGRPSGNSNRRSPHAIPE